VRNVLASPPAGKARNSAKTYNLNFLLRHSTFLTCVTKIPLTQIILFTSIESSRRDFPVGLTGIFYSVLKVTVAEIFFSFMVNQLKLCKRCEGLTLTFPVPLQ